MSVTQKRSRDQVKATIKIEETSLIVPDSRERACVCVCSDCVNICILIQEELAVNQLTLDTDRGVCHVVKCVCVPGHATE